MTDGEIDASVAIPTYWRSRPPRTELPGLRRDAALESPTLSAELHGKLLVKAEGLQKTGSFKLRGAFNRLSMLTDAERRRGVVAVSSGNHGQAVAYSAKALGTTAIVVMPTSAPKIKIERIQARAADIVLHDRTTRDLEDVGRELAAARDMVLVLLRTTGISSLVREPWVGKKSCLPGSSNGREPRCDARLLRRRRLDRGLCNLRQRLSPDNSRHRRRARRLRRYGTLVGCRATPEERTFRTNDLRRFDVADPRQDLFEIHKGHLGGALMVTDDEVVSAMHTAFTEFGLVVEAGRCRRVGGGLGRPLRHRGENGRGHVDRPQPGP